VWPATALRIGCHLRRHGRRRSSRTYPFAGSRLEKGSGDVLSGRIRLVQGDQDRVLEFGDAAEFDTQTSHWAGNAGDTPAELLMLFGRQGEHAQLVTEAK
jgi:hypothetical protein